LDFFREFAPGPNQAAVFDRVASASPKARTALKVKREEMINRRNFIEGMASGIALSKLGAAGALGLDRGVAAADAQPQ